MITQRTRMAAVAAVAALGLVGCGSDSGDSASSSSTTNAGSSDASTGSATDSGATGATRQFIADNGTVTIPTHPKRVIATGYAVPALLEGKAPLVGISTWKRALEIMSPEVKKAYDSTPKIGGDTAKETNYEQIAKAKPDLIVIGVPKPVLADIDLDRLKKIAPVVALGPGVPDAWRTVSKTQMDAAGVLPAYNGAKTTYERKAAALKTKYAGVLGSLKFGHVGGYGEIAQGTFQREYAGSWGTNIQQDIGVKYYGEVTKKTGGSGNVSEYVSIEDITKSLGEADAITYTLNDDGTVPDSIKYVLNSALWKTLPAVKNNKVFPMRYVQASTYTQALRVLDAADKSFAPLLTSAK